MTSTYINCVFGRINIDKENDSLVLSQERDGTVETIVLAPGEIEKMAKALFAIKKLAFP